MQGFEALCGIHTKLIYFVKTISMQCLKLQNGGGAKSIFSFWSVTISNEPIELIM
jgi:hypothetical protein